MVREKILKELGAEYIAAAGILYSQSSQINFSSFSYQRPLAIITLLSNYMKLSNY